jgi:hypothetical protein
MFAQQKQPVKSGVITFNDGRMTGFTHLQFIEDKVLFYNVATKKNDLYSLEEVSLIADDNQATVYKGVAVTHKKEAAEVINDTLYRPNYPEGVYETKEAFINKKPTYIATLLPYPVVGIDQAHLTTIEHACDFHSIIDGKLKNAFAVSYKGHLYFRIGAMLDNRSKTDRAQTSNFLNSFVRVILGGENYLYTEADLTNLWTQAAAYGAVGGSAGTHLAKSVVYGKGIVWDVKRAEFNIFKNCKDYNNFIQLLSPDDVQQCSEHMPDLYKVRKAIEKVK